MNIINLLNSKLPNINEKIPNINAGGCGIFASILGEKLVEMGYKPKYFVLTKSDEKLSKSQCNELSLDEINNRVEPNHIVVVLKGYYIDSNGCYRIRNTNYMLNENRLKKGMELSIVDLKKYTQHEKYWNSKFNRKHIKKIKNKIKKIDKTTSIFSLW